MIAHYPKTKSPDLKTGTSVLLAAALLFMLAKPAIVSAGEYAAAAISGKIPISPSEPAPPPSLFDNIWGLATLYENENNPYIQKIAFTGRFQTEYAHVDGLAGQNYDEWVVRRWRMGFKAQLFENFTFHSEAGFNPQTGKTFYSRLTDSYLAWSPSSALKIKAGKQSIPFTQDGRTSSKELLTIDRSNIANNFWFPQEYLPGITAGGKINNWRYFTGIYSVGTASPEFGNFDSGQAGIISLGYDFADVLNADEALLYFDYVYNDPSTTSGLFTRSLRNVGSINFHYEAGRVGLRADSAIADGIGSQSDLIGFSVMPYYNITDKLQGVLRYTFIDSDMPNGIRFGRYESRATSGRGDRYHEGYAGLNYFLYGHKLKLQSGLKYTAMEDSAMDGGEYYGWDWTTGIRISW